MRAHPLHIVVVGRPGAGKGTQACRLASSLGLTHLSTGDLLRDEVTRGTELGERAAGYMAAGSLVPDSVVDALVGKRLASLGTGTVLDGYPRTVHQAQLLDRMIDVTTVIDLHVPDVVVVERLSSRQRDDDLPETIAHRLRAYEAATHPMIVRYAQTGRLRVVDGVGDVDEVAERVLRAVMGAVAASDGFASAAG